MNRTTKYAVLIVAGMALGLLSARVAMSAEGPADRPGKANDLWDAGGSQGDLAFLDQDEAGPPGPPPGRADDRPLSPPPKRERGPDGDRQPPGPTLRAPGFLMPPPRERGGEGDRRQPPGVPRDRDRGPAPPPTDRGGEGGYFQSRVGELGLMPRPLPPEEAMEKRDPEMYKLLKEDRDLERQTHDLAMQYRQAPSDQGEKIKQQIVDVANKQFDVRQQRRTLELKRLEGQLQRLRETLDRRTKARKVIVEKRVADLVGREDDLGF